MPRFEEIHCNHGIYCTLFARFAIIYHRAFVDRWDLGVVLGLLVVYNLMYVMYRSKQMSGQ